MINQIITSTVLIVAILLVSHLLEKRIHPCIKYALWLIVAVKLLVPFPSFENAMSILNVVNRADTKQVEYFLVDNADGDVANNTNQDGIDDVGENSTVTEAIKGRENTDTSWTNATRTWNSASIGFLIWIGGMVVCAGIFLWSNLRFRSYLRKNRRYIRTYRKQIAVYEVKGLSTPCLLGGFAPAIYLQKECDLNEEEQGYILEHEYTHYRHGDHIWAVVRCICVVVYWFHPFVWIAARRSAEDSELACDAGVLKQMPKEKHARYGKALLAVAQSMTQRKRTQQFLCCSTGATGGMGEMKRRMKMIVEKPQTRRITLVAVAVLSCCLVGCTFGNAVGSTKADMSQNEDAKQAQAELEAAEEQAKLAEAEAMKEQVQQAKVELEAAKEQAELEAERRQAEAQEGEAYELLDGEEDYTYKDVTLYAMPIEDKACLKISPSGIREYLHYYYIPEGELQAQLLEFAHSLETTDQWMDFDKRWEGKKENGCVLSYNGQEYRMFEGGYFYATSADGENKELLVQNQELSDRIYQVLSDELNYTPIDITQIKGIQSAKLEINSVITNGEYYSQMVMDEDTLIKFEEWFANAQYIYGGADCGMDQACLTLTLEGGTIITLSVACDSCPIFGANGVCYDYRPNQNFDNREFFQCFDEIPWEF